MGGVAGGLPPFALSVAIGPIPVIAVMAAPSVVGVPPAGVRPGGLLDGLLW